MSYFLYKVSTQPGNKTLEYIEEHDAFVDAKTSARARRANIPATGNYIIKMIFASDQDEAEMLLMKKQEAPILKEWEK